MLSPANRALVARDPALPAVGLVLDPAALRGWLADRWPTRTIGTLTRSYLRYKPGDSCLAGFMAEIDGAPIPLAFLSRQPTAGEKFAKVEIAAQRAADGGGTALVDERHALAFYSFPSDPALKYLPHLVSPDKRVALLEHLSLPGDASLTTVNFRPGRRYVARVDLAGEPLAVLKLHAPRAFPDILAKTSAFAQAGLEAPSIIGIAERRHAIASEWIAGNPVDRDSCNAAAIGETLSAFHRQAGSGLPSHNNANLRKLAHAMACDIARLQPSLASRAEAAASRVAEALPAASELVTLHGDFHLKQVIETPGGMRLIDLDEAVRGPAAVDLATLLAHEALRMPRFAMPEDIAEGLLEGYRAAGGAVASKALDGHLALALLRLALQPFREQWEDWPDAIARLLDRVDRICPAQTAAGAGSEARANPLDPAIPQIEGALDPSQVTLCLAAAGVELAAESADLVRHKPGRRCLIRYRLRTAAGEPVEAFGKLRAKGADSRTFALHQALREDGLVEGQADAVFVTRPLALVPELSMWVQEAAAGQAFSPENCPAQKAADAIAALHQSRVKPLRRHLLADELDILSTRFVGFTDRRPDIADRLAALLDTAIAFGERVQSVPLRPIHRDFYQDHLLLTDKGTCLLDLDLVALGDPAVDIGNFLAHLTELGLRSHADPFRFAEWQEQFHHSAARAGLTASINIEVYEFLSLVRLTEIADRMPERREFVGKMMVLCERQGEAIRTRSRRPA